MVPVGEVPSLSVVFLKALLVVFPVSRGSVASAVPTVWGVGVQDREGTGRRCVCSGEVGGGAGFWLVPHSAQKWLL